jgi:hypothetical protein
VHCSLVTEESDEVALDQALKVTRQNGATVSGDDYDVNRNQADCFKT